MKLHVPYFPSFRLQKELLQREQELKVLKKDYLVSQRHLEEETGKVSDGQKKNSKLAGRYFKKRVKEEGVIWLVKVKWLIVLLDCRHIMGIHKSGLSNRP